jgi:hypothetical protein
LQYLNIWLFRAWMFRLDRASSASIDDLPVHRICASSGLSLSQPASSPQRDPGRRCGDIVQTAVGDTYAF